MTFRATMGILALSLCWGPVAQARGSVPIVAHDNITLTAASAGPLTPDQVRGAIIRAGTSTRYPWTITAGGDHALVASSVVRGKHTAEVTISYTRSSITVTYRDSKNLNYRVKNGMPQIHPNYNVWVQDLIDAIQREALKSR